MLRQFADLVIKELEKDRVGAAGFVGLCTFQAASADNIWTAVTCEKVVGKLGRQPGRLAASLAFMCSGSGVTLDIDGK